MATEPPATALGTGEGILEKIFRRGPLCISPCLGEIHARGSKMRASLCVFYFGIKNVKKSMHYVEVIKTETYHACSGKIGKFTMW